MLWSLGQAFRRDDRSCTLLAQTPVYVLGFMYPDLSRPETYAAFAHHFESILWVTYRKDFAPIRKNTFLKFTYGITSDTGWGCMMRSGQMMLANGFLFHYLGRKWRRPRVRVYGREGGANMSVVQEGCYPREYTMILDWFYDDPSRRYSIQRIVEMGSQFGKEAAQWHGPSTICNVIDRLVNHRDDVTRHMLSVGKKKKGKKKHKRRRGRKGAPPDAASASAPAGSSELDSCDQPSMPALAGIDEDEVVLYCARDCAIYVDELIQLCTRQRRKPTSLPQRSRTLPPTAAAAAPVASSSRTVVCASESDEEEGVDDDTVLVSFANIPGGRAPSDGPEPYVAPAGSHSPTSIAPSLRQQLPPQPLPDVDSDSDAVLVEVPQRRSEEPVAVAVGSGSEEGQSQAAPHFSPVIIIMSIRLGVDRINPAYLAPIQQLLAFPYTLGIAGGRPRHSLYFVGFQNNDLLYLDPHKEQKISINPNTYHCAYVRTVKFKDIDPSMAIGFHIRTRKDLDVFVQKAKAQFAGGLYPICSIQPTRPRYDGGGIRMKEEILTL